MYDLYVPMAAQVDMKIPYGKACDIVCEGSRRWARSISISCAGIREGGWADVYENQGKTSGAYSWGVWGTHPYVLLNWNDTLDNLFTLAHELGHAMHSHLSDTAQPYAKSQYPLLLAEVASTCNEAILMDYMLRRAGRRRETHICWAISWSSSAPRCSARSCSPSSRRSYTPGSRRARP